MALQESVGVPRADKLKVVIGEARAELEKSTGKATIKLSLVLASHLRRGMKKKRFTKLILVVSPSTVG